MIPYGFHPDAEAELLEALRFYNRRQQVLGQGFLSEIHESVVLIRSNPRMAPVVDDVFRAKALRRFPYVLIYVHEDWGIEIYAVMHKRRRPGYWRSRRNP